MKKITNQTRRNRSTRAQVEDARRQIAIMVGTGVKAHVIADLLKVSRQTVYSHISKMKKAGLIVEYKETPKVSRAPRKRSVTTASAPAWTMNTPFGSVTLKEGAEIKIKANRAEITWN